MLPYKLVSFVTPNRSPRVGAPIYLCIHSTEGSTVEGAMAVFKSSKAQASCDEIISTDGKVVAVCNRPETRLKTWQVGNANSLVACGFESVGFAGRTIWPDSFYTTLADRLVRARNRTKKTYGVTIPLKRSTVKGHPGIIRHLDCSRWYGGSTHTDPGSTFSFLKLDAAIQNRLRPSVRFRYAIRGGAGKLLAAFSTAGGLRTARWGRLYKTNPNLEVRKEEVDG